MGFRRSARRAAAKVRPHAPQYIAEGLESRRLLAGEVYSAWAEPASVPEGQPASFFVKVDLDAAATNSYTLIVPYAFPVPVPGPGIANPSPPPANLQADHSGQASGGTVGVTIYAGAQSGQAVLNVSAFIDGVTEGAEVARFVVKDGAAEANLTITDTTYGAPPPGGDPPPGGGGTPVNRPPVVNDASMRMDEYAGLTATMTGSYSDPDGDPVNCNATGLLQGETFTAENGVWKWTFSRSDGPMTRSINITAYSTGGSDTATATATVSNVAPYVHGLVVLPTAIDEGGSVTLTGQITDPGADTFTLYFDWDGDGAWDETLPAGSARTFTRSHAYPDDDPTGTPFDVKSVRAGVRDDDGAGDDASGSSSTGASTTVRVNNVAPSVLTALATTPIVVGERAIVEAGLVGGTPFTARGTFADPGQPDTFNDGSKVNYGDGSDPADVILTGPRAFDVPGYVYPLAGDYFANVTIEDDDRGVSPTSDQSKVPVTAVGLGELKVTDASNGDNQSRSAGLDPSHLFVGEKAGGVASVDLDLTFGPNRNEVKPHLLWKVTGQDIVVGGAVTVVATGNFAAQPLLTLKPRSDADRTFTVEAGFDDDASGELEGSEISRRAKVHVIRPDLDADSDNNNGTAPPARDATEDGMEAAPPGKYVLLNDDDDNNNDLPDLGEGSVNGEDDLVPLVLGFEHLGSYREGLTYKLSLAGTGADKAGVWADAGKGASVALGTPAPVPPAGSRTVWVEGRALSQVEGDVQFELEILAPTYSAGMLAVAKDDLRETVIKVDLDVDSDDGDKFNPLFPRSLAENAEDRVEDKAGGRGKVIAVNDEDTDGDHVPDFADGFNRYIEIEHELSWGDQFVPLVLEVPDGIDLNVARFKFNYSASDPAAVTRTGEGTDADPWVYTPAPGSLRLWLKDGTRRRDEDDATENGDFVANGVDYTSHQLEFDPGSRKLTLWAEAIQPSMTLGDLRIGVEVDPDGSGPAGFIAPDAVRLTAIDLDVLIGADNPGDESMHDDWVGAKNAVTGHVHEIMNLLRVQGPPEFVVDLALDHTVTGNGTIDLPRMDPDVPQLLANYPVTPGASGVGAIGFVIGGGTASATTENIVVKGLYKGQLFGFETLTVLGFSAEPATGGVLNVPVNPVHVSSWATAYGGNLFAADAGELLSTASVAHLSDRAMGTTPRLLTPPYDAPVPVSRKLTPDKIEVVCAREILTGGTSAHPLAKSTFGTALTVDPPTNSTAPVLHDNLRVRDTGFPSQLDGAENTEVNYYLGHPTETALTRLNITSNYATRIQAKTTPRLTYRVALNVLEYRDAATGATTSTGLSADDLRTILDTINVIWSQVGINFARQDPNVAGTTLVTNDDTLFYVKDDEIALGPGFSSSDEVSAANTSPAIDIYFVHSIIDPESGGGTANDVALNGVTFFTGSANDNLGWVPSILMARYTSKASGAMPRTIAEISRTLAHEIGHYLAKQGDDWHRPEVWNLMVSGDAGSLINRDLDADQLQRITESGPPPGFEDF